MKNLSVNEVREAFLAFFDSKQHMRLPSFSLVPQNDKSLLLINSGMAPMKTYFTGQETPPAPRVATCQKCIRTGDIDNVGKTARHGTFFEMLGNFSFGDYFKNEIVPWSWEFVTETMGMPVDKLYVTIYEEDDETGDIWRDVVGLPKDRIVKLGKADNFWEHGTGPCGPCTEIYYDRGESYGCDSPTCGVGCDCDRYMEFWNLVLTQFYAHPDGTYTELDQKNVDTGMGLERMAAILQGVDSIFDVDTVRAVRDWVCKKANVVYGKGGQVDVSVRVITDHIRSVTMMTADGVLPSNEGRGYVLRRLLRKGARHGKLLGIQGEFLAELSKEVIKASKDAYPELGEKQEYILKILSLEENAFYNTLDKGMLVLEDDIKEMKQSGSTVMSGVVSFRLYDTYGFPLDLTKEILEEQGLSVDEEGFQNEMQQQKERARAARGTDTYMGTEATIFDELPQELSTTFKGYDNVVCEATLSVLVKGNAFSETATDDDAVTLFFDETVFYSESGGQIGDHGTFTTDTGVVDITNCTKVGAGKVAHVGIVRSGTISAKAKGTLAIDDARRKDIGRNHTATHLLQKALRTVLGDHVEQAGSLVTEEKLRFDFTHFTAMTEEELQKVEALVNESILSGYPVETSETTIDEARKKGAMALFGEKYGATVRVVDMGGYSVELCGGTHMANTAQVGSFKIISESGVAAGVRRMEAVTGKGALAHYSKKEATVTEICKLLKTTDDAVISRLEQVLAEQKQFIRDAEKLKAQMVSGTTDDIVKNTVDIAGVSVIVSHIDGMDAEDMRTLGDQLKNKIPTCVIVLIGGTKEKVNLLAMATDDVVKKGVHAGKLIKEVAGVCGGGGGGRPNMAQAGGKDATKIPEALEKAKEVLTGQLS
ncbi:MAG: alanine--tRNA ligase [Bacillota bacterium]